MNSLESLSKESVTLLHKNRLLLPLIRAELIKDILSKINIEHKDKIDLIETSKQKVGINNQTEYDSWLSARNLDEDDFEYMSLAKVRMDKYCQTKFENKVTTRFLERKSELDIVVYSLFRASDFFIAKELFMQVFEGESEFGDVAAKYSERFEKKTRGIIGPVPVEQAHPKLRNLLRNSPIGQIQAPRRIDDSYVVIRVESYDPAKLDDLMKEKMYEE